MNLGIIANARQPRESFQWDAVGDVDLGITPLIFGWGWTNNWAAPVPFVGFVAYDYFDQYSVIDPVTASTLTTGYGWSAAWVRSTGYELLAQEDFQSYSDTTGVAAASLTGGTGWSGAPQY
jgi:hypothetical protein